MPCCGRRICEPANEAALLKTFIKAGPPDAIPRSFKLQTVLRPPRSIRTPHRAKIPPGRIKRGVGTCGLSPAFELFSERPQFFRSAMSDQFQIYDVALKRRGRGWTWCVCTSEETVVIWGREDSRAAARYKAARALFLLLLSASYRSTPSKASNGVRLREQSTRRTSHSEGLPHSAVRLYKNRGSIEPRLGRGHTGAAVNVYREVTARERERRSAMIRVTTQTTTPPA